MQRLLLIVVGALVLAGCGDDDGASAPVATGSSAATVLGAEVRQTTIEPALTVRQLIGQRLIASFRGSRRPPAALKARIARGELAGVVLFAENAPTIAAARRVADELQAIPRPPGLRDPLLVMVDQEGGLVRRLGDAPPRRSALEASRRSTPSGVEAEGRRTAAALRRAGVNVDLAPVVDVPRSGSAMLREGRTYGRSLATVRRLAPRFARGLERGGVAATAKHFPGFGAATVNTDDAPATIGLSAAQLRRVDEAAFAAATAAGTRLVMLSNAIYPAFDARRPATLSRAIATRELRQQLGFTGVSVTDDLQANALARYGGPGLLAVASARAGADLLLFGRSLQATETAARALEQAVDTGALPRDELERGARRVLALRASRDAR